MIDKIANEAARIKRENPELKFYEAVIEAKKIIKEGDKNHKTVSTSS